MDLVAFAAERNARLVAADEEIESLVRAALSRWGAANWTEPIVTGASVLFLEILERENPTAPAESYLPAFQRELEETLQKTKRPEAIDRDVQVARITRWIGTYSVNSATYFATRGVAGRKIWVSMGDDDVRSTHQQANGQSVPLLGLFDVAGVRMRFPGEPVGPPEVWINCRCLVAADVRGEATVNPETFEMDPAVEREQDVMVDELDNDGMVDEVVEIPVHGILAPEGSPSGDGRQFAVGALTSRDLPLPLLFQTMSGESGHVNSVAPARIDKIWRTDDNMLAFEGAINPNHNYADEIVDGIVFGNIRGVSVDIDDYELQAPEFSEDGEQQGTMMFSRARIAAATIVAIPAFHEAYIALGYYGEEPKEQEDSEEDDVLVASVAPEGAREEAQRGIDWVAEGHGGSGLEPATIQRARKIVAGSDLTDDHIKRMRSFFARHEVNKKAEGFSPGEDGYPSPGRVAWALWGGDAGFSFAKAEVKRMDREADAVAGEFRDYSPEEREKLAGQGQAMPDGSYPIADEEDLKNAIQAYGRASNPEEVKAHIEKRARELDLEDLLPESWDEDSMQASATFAPGTKDGPGWLTNPRATARIRRYWTQGEGAAKIRWGLPGDFNRCRRQMAKYVNPAFLAGTCANMHKEATGTWPGRQRGDLTLAEASSPAMSLVAAAVDRLIESTWFHDPELAGPTAITVTDEGRIFGHLATWGTCHIGFEKVCTTPPNSKTNYAMFLLGAIDTTDGEVAVGQITLGTGHASLRAGARAAASHYDNTGLAVADVTAGEDGYGIWVSGAIRAGLSDEELRELKAAKLSGDWRKVGGNLELVAALAVNVPGFPVPRTALAASGGHQTALVASGIVEENMAEMSGVKVELNVDQAVGLVAAVADELEYRQEKRDRLAAARIAYDAEVSKRQNVRATRALAAKSLIEV